jgi:hypothetical protein
MMETDPLLEILVRVLCRRVHCRRPASVLFTCKQPQHRTVFFQHKDVVVIFDRRTAKFMVILKSVSWWSSISWLLTKTDHIDFKFSFNLPQRYQEGPRANYCPRWRDSAGFRNLKAVGHEP